MTMHAQMEQLVPRPSLVRGETGTATLMRQMNRSRVLHLVRQSGPISRTAVADRLSMSLPTVMRSVNDLIAEDLIRMSGISEGTKGRPRPLIEFNGDSYGVVGIDLGGTKMFGALGDLTGTIHESLYTPHKGSSPEQRVDELVDFIRHFLTAAKPPYNRIRGVGVGIPGVTTFPEGVVGWAPSLGWRNLPLRDILAERLRVPVFVDNDVNLAALGEWGFGAGRGTSDMVCIAIGTGVGGGLILGGELYRGHNQLAGEIGYILPGQQYLGQRYDGFGALELLASGTGVAERARQYLKGPLSQAIGPHVSAESVFAAARRGDAWARHVVAETVDYLSMAVASVEAILDPEVIILGGGVAQSADLLIDPILQRLQGTLPRSPRIVPSTLGYQAAVMGAIMMVLKGTTAEVFARRSR